MAIIDFLKEYAKILKQDRKNKVILIFAFVFYVGIILLLKFL